MEKNHLPSSPLQHHHPSSSRSRRPSNPSPIESSDSNKLNVPRPSNPCASPPTATTSLTPWAQQERQVDRRWHSKPSTLSGDGSKTEPIASSSRCPTPPLIPHIPGPARHRPSTRLLTSEPLNRSSSQHVPITIHYTHPSPQTTSIRKRARAASLPTASPDFKRRKSRHQTITPSDQWQRTFEHVPEPSKHHIQRERAAALATQLLAGRKLRSASPPIGEQIVVAANQPPINLASLRGLDATEILKNPQLRHDLLFDSLAFRPINSTAPFPHSYAEVLNSGTTPVFDPRTSSVVVDMYWESVAEELATGCRCARWEVNGGEHRMDVATLEKRERVMRCLCGKWRPDLTEGEWWKWQGSRRWQSRIPELVKTLREILISLMGSTTPCTSHFAHSFSREALDAHEVTCPTVTHALVPELYAALDPEFLTIRVRRGVFGLSLFQVMGQAMKVHCAPVRDAMVDDIVRTAMSGSVAKALRKCFDCVEVMKLDICNHQVHALRPYLWNSALQCELSAFHALLAQTHVSLETSITRKWIRAASRRVLASMQPSERNRLIRRRRELALCSNVDGFVDLVSADWSSDSPIWPPVVQRRVIGPGELQFLEGKAKNAVEVPESFKMDSRRIKEFHAEIVDLTISSMLLLAVRDLLRQAHGAACSSRLAHIQFEIQHTFAQPSWFSQISTCSSTISDFALRLSMRIHGRDCPSGAISERSNSDIVCLTDTARTIDGFITANITYQSPLFISSFKGVRGAVTQLLTHELLVQLLDPACDLYDESMTDSVPLQAEHHLTPAARVREHHACSIREFGAEEERILRSTGLEVVEADLRGLVKRMERIVGFNADVFGDVYAGSGMMVGS